MKGLKVTEEYRIDTEEEVQAAIDYFKSKAVEGGYSIGKCGYTYKEKKAKGEVIDKGYLLSVTKVYGGFFD